MVGDLTTFISKGRMRGRKQRNRIGAPGLVVDFGNGNEIKSSFRAKGFVCFRGLSYQQKLKVSCRRTQIGGVDKFGALVKPHAAR